MGKITRTTKILGAIFNGCFRDRFRRLDNELVGSSKYIALTFEPHTDGAYTFISPRSTTNRRIVIGGEMIKKVAELPNTFSKREAFTPYKKPVYIAFNALNYHEVAHNIFTDMSDQSIAQYPIAKYRGFLHNLFNILEDIIIERGISAYYTKYYPKSVNPQYFFDYMVERLFEPQCSHYSYAADPNNFLNYLLLILRCGKAKVKNTNEVFEKYSTDLLPLIKDVLCEKGANERVHKTVALGEWIIEHIKEFDWSTVSITEKEIISGKITEDWGDPKEGEGPSRIPEEVEDPKDPTEKEGEEKGKPHDELKPRSEDGKSEDSDVSDAPEDVETDEEKKEREDHEVEESLDDMDEDLEDTFIDRFNDGSDHLFVLAKDYYEVTDSNLVPKIEKEIESYLDPINDISETLKLFHERCGEEMRSGFDAGELDVDAAIQDDMEDGINLDLFQDEVKTGQDVDLCVSLLCDNSGSMSGSRSIIASQAALVLAQACEWANIPFECQCFTKTLDCSSGTSVTIIEKRFEDTFEESKPYFAINDSGLIRGLREIGDVDIPTFSGNSEEINLYYIWQQFRKVDHKTKLLFVMCDGATTGSKSDLKQVVREMEQDGIIVIGLGIETNIGDIYPLHKNFMGTDELRRELANYLIDTLSQYAGL